MKVALVAVALGAILAAAGGALAGTPALVSVTQAWARATPPGAANGVVYMTLRSTADDRLIGVSAPVAARAGVHETLTDGGIVRMRPVVGGVVLPAGQAVVLQPGGYHIMLEGLTGALVRGGTVTVHLMFATAPPLDVAAPVLAIGAGGPAAGDAAMPGMDMGR